MDAYALLLAECSFDNGEDVIKELKPLFIFSLPRAGSTLVQRILSTHTAVSTVTEPWLLLPYLYASRKDGIYAEYGQHAAADAIEDFCRELPGGKQDYNEELAAFILRLYEKASTPEARYFLDKTPRYHLVAEEIMGLFPHGKFIYLWRNPLSVAASIMETWKDGRWNLYAWKVDLYDGLVGIIDAYGKNMDASLALRYEDMIRDPGAQLKRISEYLALPFDPKVIENFAEVKLKGRMGDPVGVNRFKKVSKEPLEKWKKTFNNPVRKAWARRYLDWIGRDRLSLMGYDLDILLAELDGAQTSFKYMGSDVIRIIYGLFYCLFDPRPLKYKIGLLSEWRWLHANS